MDAVLDQTERTQADVEAAAQAAGLHSQHPVVQLLQFSSDMSAGNDIKLLELPPNVLHALEEGQRVVLKGSPQEDAVLCTDNLTYDVKLAETSNSLLVCPTLNYPNDQLLQANADSSLVAKEVTACMFSTYELREARPRLERLKALLWECPYRGQQDNEEEEQNIYTLHQLLDMVQSSEQQLMEGLETLQACNIDGHWRVFATDYQEQVFQDILTLVEAEGWEWSRIPLTECSTKMTPLAPQFAADHCLRCYGNLLDSDTIELSEYKVCRFYAELLLRPAGRFNYNEFLESWEQSVPIGMTTTLDQLKGIALSNLSSTPPVIWHFPCYELPQDPVTRFSKLFGVRSKWTHDELEPYIRDLESPTQSLKALLLKFTRASKDAQGVKRYDLKTTALSQPS